MNILSGWELDGNVILSTDFMKINLLNEWAMSDSDTFLPAIHLKQACRNTGGQDTLRFNAMKKLSKAVLTLHPLKHLRGRCAQLILVTFWQVLEANSDRT